MSRAPRQFSTGFCIVQSSCKSPARVTAWRKPRRTLHQILRVDGAAWRVRRWILEERQGKRMSVVAEKGPGALSLQARRKHSPALTWLSLVELLPSRAQLRFTKRGEVYLRSWNPPPNSARTTMTPPISMMRPTISKRYPKKLKRYQSAHRVQCR